MTNLWGPGAFFAARPAAVRPTVTPANGAGDPDDWFKDCTSQEARDGTELRSGLVNALIANLRSLVRKSGHPVTNLDDDLLTRSIRKGFNYISAAGGTAQNLTVTLDPAPSSYAEITGVAFRILIVTPNTGPGATFEVLPLGPKTVKRQDGTAIAKNDLRGISTVVYDGTDFRLLSQTTEAGGVPTNAVNFTTPGAGTWTVPAGVYRILVRIVGGGGGGAGGSGSANGYAGGGGGGGGYAEKYYDVTPGQVIPYVVGAGGAGSGPGIDGVNGGTTSFNSGDITATGGQGGDFGLFGGPGGLNVFGGVGSGGSLNLSGGLGNGVQPAGPGNTGIGSAGGGTHLAPGGAPAASAGASGNAPGGGANGGGGVGAGGGNGAHGLVQIIY